MQEIFLVFSYLSVLLIVGVILRFKIKLFQNLFIPASLLGGVVGLIINLIFPLSFQKTVASIPSILIIPIIVSIPLGMEINLNKEKKSLFNILKMVHILFIVTMFQLFIGFTLNFIFDKLFNINLYEGFGAELNAGFAGGHGTAGMIGRIFKDLGSKNWELAQGIATTTATFGLIGGIIIGIISINYAIKRKKTAILKEASLIPLELKKGLVIEKISMGNETVHSSCLDTLSFHLAIIMVVSGFAYISVDIFKKYKVPILSSISSWIFGMIVMSIIWYFLKKNNFDFLIDKKIKSKLSIAFTDFAIVSAVSTLPVKLIFSYIVPILILIIFGFIGTYFCIFTLSNKYFKDDYSFERGIAILGTSYGVFFTGILLLRICDPNFESPILEEYSISFALIAFIGPILILLSISLAIKYGAFIPALFLLAGIIGSFIIYLFLNLENS